MVAPNASAVTASTRRSTVAASVAVQAQDATSASLQRAQVAQRLGRDQGAEALLPAGDRQVAVRFGGELQEDASGRAALVQLPGRMQEARSEAGGGGIAEPVAHQHAYPIERLDRIGVLGQVGQDREVVAGTDGAQQRAKCPVDGHRLVAKDRAVGEGGESGLGHDRCRLPAGCPAAR